MTTITIPKEMTKMNNLIAIPRKEYERFLGLNKKTKMSTKKIKQAVKIKQAIPEDQKWFWTKEWQKGEREADEDIKAGRMSGPFTNAEDLIKSLKAND